MTRRKTMAVSRWADKYSDEYVEYALPSTGSVVLTRNTDFNPAVWEFFNFHPEYISSDMADYCHDFFFGLKVWCESDDDLDNRIEEEFDILQDHLNSWNEPHPSLTAWERNH